MIIFFVYMNYPVLCHKTHLKCHTQAVMGMSWLEPGRFFPARLETGLVIYPSRTNLRAGSSCANFFQLDSNRDQNLGSGPSLYTSHYFRKIGSHSN